MEIGNFLGIMCTFCTDTASPAHFHAVYKQHSATIDIKTGGVVAGTLPPRVAGVLAEWTWLHKEKLEKKWSHHVEGNIDMSYIPPLVE